MHGTPVDTPVTMICGSVEYGCGNPGTIFAGTANRIPVRAFTIAINDA